MWVTASSSFEVCAHRAGESFTRLTFIAASSHGGGTYIIAWGPVVYGFVKRARAQFRIEKLVSLRERLDSPAPPTK